jgi:hypothetical protein
MPYHLMFLRSIQWLLMSVIDIAMNFISILFVNWWVIFFGRQMNQTDRQWQFLSSEEKLHAQVLPKYLKWFETMDNSLDEYWLNNYDQVNPNKWTAENPPKYWRRKWYQWKWLMRNINYTFSWGPMGIQWKPETWTIVKDIKRDDLTVFFAYSTEGFWSFSASKKYGNYKLGWKVKNFWNSDTQSFKTSHSWFPRTQIVSTVNPFKR